MWPSCLACHNALSFGVTQEITWEIGMSLAVSRGVTQKMAQFIDMSCGSIMRRCAETAQSFPSPYCCVMRSYAGNRPVVWRVMLLSHPELRPSHTDV